MQRIAVVDDEPEVRRTVQRLLVAQGYDVAPLGTKAELFARLVTHTVDLVVLDLDLGGEDGLAIARDVRAQHALPILILTGHGSTFDKVAGLEAGADDYLTKPFDAHELVARVRALLRRVAGAPAVAAPRAWRFGGWLLNEAARELRAPDGTVVGLTAHEFAILTALAAAGGAPVGRDALSHAVRGRDDRPGDRSLDVRVARLRAKLAEHGGEALIKTHRGRGYLLAAMVAPQDAVS